MKKFITLFLYCFVGFANALQFGVVGNNYEYQTFAITENDLYGKLQIVELEKDDAIGGDYEVILDDIKVLNVKQERGFFVSKFYIADINLPHGVYKVKVKKTGFMVDEKFTEFDVLVKAQKNIAIKILRGKANVGYMNYVGSMGGYSFTKSEDFDLQAMNKVIAGKIDTAKEDFAKDNELAEINYKKEQEIDAKKKEAAIKARNEQKIIDKKFEEAEKIKRKNEQIFAESKRINEANELKKIVDAEAKQDDAACKSYGAAQGTQAYVMCRATFATKRAEAKEGKAVADKFEAYMEQQERLRLEDKQAQDARAAMLQKSIDDDRKRREKRQNIDDAESLLRGAARMGGQQDTITCTSTFGNTINCRK